MKKLFTSLFVLAILMIAKVDAQPGLSYSVKIIPQLSFFQSKNNNNKVDNKAILRAGFGVGAAYNFTNNFGVGADVLYSLQGQRYKLNSKEYNQKNDYVKVPVYFSYNSDASKEVSFIAKIGEQIGFVTNLKLNGNDSNKIDVDAKGQKQTVIFGAVASAGAQYRLKNHLFLTTALRFDYDFHNTEDDTFSDYSYESQNAFVTTGVEVGLKFMFR